MQTGVEVSEAEKSECGRDDENFSPDEAFTLIFLHYLRNYLHKIGAARAPPCSKIPGILSIF